MTTQLSLSLPPVLPSRLQAAVEATFLGAGYPYQVTSDEYGWRTTVAFDGTKGSLHAAYYTDEERQTLVLQFDPRIWVTEATRGETALLLAWLSTYMHFESYHLAPDTGRVWLRVALAEELGVVIDADAVHQMTILALAADKHYSAKIREVAEGRTTAQDAFLLLVPHAFG